MPPLSYIVLNRLAILAPLLVVAWLSWPTIRFFAPRRLGLRPRKNDALMAAVLLDMLNRAWFGARAVVFHDAGRTFARWEVPYLNASYVWALVCVLCLGLVAHGYRRQE